MHAAERVSTATPWWFWVFAVLFLLFQLVGVLQLPTQFLASEAVQAARLPPPAIAIMRAQPWWATTGCTLALVAGFLGAVCLIVPRSRHVVGALLATWLARRAVRLAHPM